MNGVSTLWVLTGLASLIGVLIVWLQRHPEQMRRLTKTFGEKGVMSAQYDPHTPLWRRVLSLPHTRLGWWAVGLAGLTSLMWVLMVEDPFHHEPVSSGLITLTWILSGGAGGAFGSIALLLKGERSALVWVAAVFGLGAFLFFIVVLLPFVLAG